MGEKKSFAQLFDPVPSSPISMKSLSTHKGEAAIFFSLDDINKLASPFRLALVGKFSRGHLKLEKIRKFIYSLDLKNTCSVGHMDARHVLIHFASETDFHRLWTRGIWYVGNFPMRVFKWTLSFHVTKESSLVLVWFSLPSLPIHLFDKYSLFSIVNPLGKPIFIDAATANLSRPSVARICVEVDLLRPLPSWVWIGTENSNEGFWQQLQIENLPQYCSNCCHLGHSSIACNKDVLAGISSQQLGKDHMPLEDDFNQHLEKGSIGLDGGHITKKNWVPVSKNKPDTMVQAVSLAQDQHPDTKATAATLHVDDATPNKVISSELQAQQKFQIAMSAAPSTIPLPWAPAENNLQEIIC